MLEDKASKATFRDMDPQTIIEKEPAAKQSPATEAHKDGDVSAKKSELCMPKKFRRPKAMKPWKTTSLFPQDEDTPQSRHMILRLEGMKNKTPKS